MRSAGCFLTQRLSMRTAGRVTRAVWPAWVVVGAACLWGLQAVTAAETRSPADPANPPLIEVSELAALWESQRSEIATAVVRFLCFNGGVDNPENTPRRVAALLDEYDLVEHPEGLGPFLLALAGEPFEVPQPWEEMTLLVSGAYRRVEDSFCTFVTDGEVEFELTPSNRQLSIIPRGKSRVHHYTLDDLRWTPPPHVSAAGWRYLREEGDAVVYDVPPDPAGTRFAVTAAIDSATGIVRHSITRYPDGLPAIELYQTGLRMHAGGITFPQLHVRLTYSAGALRSARVMLVQEARFNEPVSESAFHLPVAEGTRVIDYRGEEKVGYLSKDAVADAHELLAYAPRLAAPPAAGPARPPQTSRWTLLAAINFAVLLLLAGLFVLRRRSADSRRA